MDARNGDPPAMIDKATVWPQERLLDVKFNLLRDVPECQWELSQG